MCGGGYPFTPYGMAPPSHWGMGPSLYDQQMLGMQNIAGLQQSAYNQWAMMNAATPRPAMKPKPKPKKCVCAYCGRPAKPTTETSCPGCGAWEVEFR